MWLSHGLGLSVSLFLFLLIDENISYKILVAFLFRLFLILFASATVRDDTYFTGMLGSLVGTRDSPFAAQKVLDHISNQRRNERHTQKL